MSYEKRKIKYHPDVDFHKDSVILRETFIRYLENLQKATVPSEEIAKALENFKTISQPPQAFLKAIENIQKATVPLREVAIALENLVKVYRPRQDLLRAVENMQEAIEPSRKFLAALTDGEKLMKIVEEYEKE